jgi:alpha-L-rhamnosidase
MRIFTPLLRLLSACIILLSFGLSICFAAAPGAPTYLRTCDKVKPAGTNSKPYFGWYVNDNDNNEVQTAYQILVASSLNNLNSGKADVWDSGKVPSSMQNYVDLAGKAVKPATRYYWKVRTWDKTGKAGIYSAVSYFDTGLFTLEDWMGAKWVKRNTDDKDDYTYYRKNVAVAGKTVKRAMVYVAACHNYELYLNGKLVSKGSSNHYPQYAYYNAFDVTAWIKPGTLNNLAALTHWYGGGQGRATGSRGFILKMVTEYADGRKTITGTDNTWKQNQAAYWTAGQPPRNGEGNGFIDRIDSRNIIAGWNTAAFKDTDWDAAVEIGAPPVAPWVNALRPDLTRVVEQRIKPVSVKSLGGGKYIIDLGKIYAGMPSINFAGGQAGAMVNIRGSYLLTADGQASTKGNQSTKLDYYFTLNGKQALFQPMVYLAYRYIQVENSPNVLTADNVSFITRHFELDGSKAQFSSSDDMLNQVWNLMIHSLVQGAQEGFVDTPTREKGAFLGDGSYQGPPNMTAMGERAMNHRVLLEFLDSQDQYWPDGRLNAVYPNVDGKRDIPDYTQEYLIWIWDYYLQTGNMEFLKTNYAKIKKVADYVHTYVNPTTGLVHNLAGGGGAYKYGIIDWPQHMRYGYDMETESRTVVDALAYIDFDIISKVASVLGNTADKATYSAYATVMKQSMNTKLLNADGVYIDGLKADLTQSTHVSQQANMYAYATGIVPEAQKASVYNAVKERKMASGMVTLRYLPEAIGQAQDGQHLLDLYTNTTWDGWAKTVAKGGTMTWEAWDADTAGESLSHPWGAIGVLAMQQYMLGVTVIKPQFELIQVKPLDFKDRLKFAKGVFPGDRGNVSVDWKRDSQHYLLTLNTPDNVTAHMYIPKCGVAGSSITIDGKTVTGKEDGDYIDVGSIGSGVHTFERRLK